MLDAVKELWPKFTESFEGRTNYLYQDSKHFMTTGLGVNLDGPVPSPTATPTALRLAWENPARPGEPALLDEIRSSWRAVRASGCASTACAAVAGNVVRLPPQAVRDLFWNKTKEIESILSQRFPGYPAWPADGQLGLLSMGWAMGPYFHFPLFEESVNRMTPDFEKAARESEIIGSPRNAANRTLFENAAHVFTRDLPFAALAFPEMAKKVIARASGALSPKTSIPIAIAAGAAVVALVATMNSSKKPSRESEPTPQT